MFYIEHDKRPFDESFKTTKVGRKVYGGYIIPSDKEYVRLRKGGILAPDLPRHLL